MTLWRRFLLWLCREEIAQCEQHSAAYATAVVSAAMPPLIQRAYLEGFGDGQKVLADALVKQSQERGSAEVGITPEDVEAAKARLLH